ncbi:MAG: fasciclin domain-containing protein [Pyrinomonadaceae bacterium]
MKPIKSALNQAANFAAVVSLLFVVGAAANITASAKDTTPDSAITARSADIVDTAVAAGSFTTLAKALEAAGLIDALKADGPFTVFAPTDAAFAKLPAGTIASLLKPENKEQLKAILLYHVVSGKVTATDVMKLNGKSVKTLQGGMFKVSTKHGVRVDKASVTQTDIDASNGIIHVIDTVLMPESSNAKVKKNR